MRRILRIALMGITALQATGATADAADIQSQIELCEVCHGPSGNSETAEWPSIAAQPVNYLVTQLTLLRSKHRYDPSMSPMASELDDNQILEISKYFAAKERKPISSAASPDPLALALFAKGDPARNLRACAECHGSKGEGNAQDGTPAINRQQQTYTLKQLEAYANSSRYDGSKPGGEMLPKNTAEMFANAKLLTADERRALALLLEGQPDASLASN